MKKIHRKSSFNASVSLVALATAWAASGGASATGLPSVGHFVSGQGVIGKASQSLTIKQTSTSGIIDWSSFSIGRHDNVVFDNGSGATLNRVIGGNLSRIAGSLRATGTLYLVNSTGVIVSGTGHVVSGGNFVVSSGSISNDAFNSDDRSLFNPKAKVANRGSIAAGGTVELNGASVIETGTVKSSAVALDASKELVIAGAVTAKTSEGAGGTIITTGNHIRVTNTAKISASGTQGGVILIGGDVHGGAIQTDNLVDQTVSTAATTVVAKGARIAANASKGAGGNIVIWSDGHTTFEGAISAYGQTSGGFAEVSSHQLLSFDGGVSLTSTAGKTGTLLLDPENVIIETKGSSSNIGCDSSGDCVATGDNSVLTVADLKAALKTSDVIVSTGASGSQAGDITVAASIVWGNSNDLTLSAYRNIVVNDGVEIANVKAGDLTLRADNSGTGKGAVTFLGKGHIDYSQSVGLVSIYYDPIGPGKYAEPVDYSGDVLTDSAIPGQLTAYMLVNTAKDLENISENLAGTYALGDNVDASGTKNWNGGAGFVPIGNFIGVLDGEGHSIKNLTIDGAADAFVGLFNEIVGTIRNLGLLDVSVTGGGNNAEIGALAGANDGTISDSWMSGAVTGGAYAEVGGLIGENDGTIAESYATGTVTDPYDGYDVVGGLAGLNHGTITQSFAAGMVARNEMYGTVGGLAGENEGTIVKSYATGAVTGGGNVGGLVGGDNGDTTHTDGIITQSYATGAVAGDDNASVGGLVGDFQEGSLTQSYATGAVRGGNNAVVGGLAGVDENVGLIASSYATGLVAGGANAHIGGLIGDIDDGTITKSYATGAVTGDINALYVGGLVGRNNGGTITQSYATGTVASSGGAWVGGLVGINYGTISQSYATGSVTGGGGGLVGQNVGGTITQSYATGTVTGSGDTGGLVGSNYSGGTIMQSYATGAVSGGGSIGGLVGSNSASTTVSQSYATGPVTGSGDYLHEGGLAGDNGGVINQSYAIGSVKAGGGTNIYAGGLVGYDVSSPGSITNSYWDTTTSGISNLATGAGNIPSDFGITGLSTIALRAALPSGFDSMAWAMSSHANNGFEFLTWQTVDILAQADGLVTKSDWYSVIANDPDFSYLLIDTGLSTKYMLTDGYIAPQNYPTTLNEQCVALVVALSGLNSKTSTWSPGSKLVTNANRANGLVPGTPIATFVDGKYPSDDTSHTAIFLGYHYASDGKTVDGIYMIDQYNLQQIGGTGTPHPAEIRLDMFSSAQVENSYYAVAGTSNTMSNMAETILPRGWNSFARQADDLSGAELSSQSADNTWKWKLAKTSASSVLGTRMEPATTR